MKQREERRKAWQAHVQRQQGSGKTRREYCEENGLSYWSFLDWKKKLDKEEDADHPLVKIRSKAPDVLANETGIDLTLRNGITLHVKEGFSGELLRAIIRELGA